MEISFFKKTGTICILIIVLMVPLTVIDSLISERKYRSLNAGREIYETWGGNQTVLGPVLTLPYMRDKKSRGYIHVLPESLTVRGEIEPETRKRGIYEFTVYRSDIELDSRFLWPDVGEWGIGEEQVLWDSAFVSVGVTQLNGVQSGVSFNWHGKDVLVRSGGLSGIPFQGLHARVAMEGGINGEMKEGTTVGMGESSGGFEFRVRMPLQGAQGLNFTPVGKNTLVTLNSAWPHPGFEGRYFPSSREISDSGFSASWDIASFGRNVPGVLMSEGKNWGGHGSVLARSAFGVKLVSPVDHYTMSDRAVKYAFFLICITFLTFFIFEVTRKFRIHPMQYVLVGISLCLFYLLLLSMSEHIGFVLSYVLAALACVLSVGGYSLSILKERVYSFIIMALLGGMFGAFYVILSLEDFALLLGSAGLFLALGFIMYITRNIDWYGSFEVSGTQLRKKFEKRDELSISKDAALD